MYFFVMVLLLSRCIVSNAMDRSQSYTYLEAAQVSQSPTKRICSQKKRCRHEGQSPITIRPRAHSAIVQRWYDDQNREIRELPHELAMVLHGAQKPVKSAHTRWIQLTEEIQKMNEELGKEYPMLSAIADRLTQVHNFFLMQKTLLQEAEKEFDAALKQTQFEDIRGLIVEHRRKKIAQFDQEEAKA